MQQRSKKKNPTKKQTTETSWEATGSPTWVTHYTPALIRSHVLQYNTHQGILKQLKRKQSSVA